MKTTPSTFPIPRRQFLHTSSALSIGFSLFGCLSGNPMDLSLPGEKNNDDFKPIPDDNRIDAWLQILEDGNVQILTGKMELGQGLTVAMQQVAGEELNIPPHKIKVVLADTGRTQNEGYTAGSRSMERSAITVRRAAAAARETLIDMAAKYWKITDNQVDLNDGFVVHKGNTTKLTFQDLLSNKQLAAQIPDQVKLKPKEQYQWVGKPIPHPDLELMVRGESIFVQDMVLPDMVHARIIRPPSYGARFAGWKTEPDDLPGVLKIVVNGSFIAVVADEEYVAEQAKSSLLKKAQWEAGPQFPEINTWDDYIISASGTESPSPEQNTRRHRAVYTKPYVMHGSIGPSCAIGHYADGLLRIWSHTQGVYPLRSTLSDLTGLSEEAIRVTGVRGAGCYGHNGADDAAAEAALVALAFPDRPIRLQWQRSEEHQWEPYGTAMRMELSATLGSDGKIESWTYDLWSDSHSTRPRGTASHFVSARHLSDPYPFSQPSRVGGGSRNAEPYYVLPKKDINNHHFVGPLRSSALRSLGAYANIFAIESFMEELAEATNQHPLDFRLNHLEDVRAVAVIQSLKEKIEKQTLKDNEGIGYGFSRYKNTAAYCAVAAKVYIDLNEQLVRPVKMWAVLDAGEAINPDGLKNQTEGGMIQSLSWTLLEEVQFDQTEVESKNWASYPILRFDQIPETDVVIIDRPELPPLGAGEAAQGPAAAAVANAVSQACGTRVRNLPIVKALFG